MRYLIALMLLVGCAAPDRTYSETGYTETTFDNATHDQLWYLYVDGVCVYELWPHETKTVWTKTGHIVVVRK